MMINRRIEGYNGIGLVADPADPAVLLLPGFGQTRAAWDRGVPISADAMANFECSLRNVLDGGDHFIVIGRVERVCFDPACEPLLFLRGRYRRVHVARDDY